MAQPEPKPERAEVPDLPTPPPFAMLDRATCSLCGAIAPCAATAQTAICRVCAEAIVSTHDEADAKEHPALRAARAAPIDDEPETEEERRRVQEARDAVRRGDVISDEELAKELGL